MKVARQPLVPVAFLVCCSWIAGAAARADDFQVPLSVEESLGVARQSEPISGGVPLPAGRFHAGQPFSLAREDGTALPCQVSPLVVETDGTLRWVLVDFQDDVGAGAMQPYVLRAGNATARPSVALKIDESEKAVTVDTGKIRFVVDKTQPFGLFREVTAGAKQVIAGGEVSYTQLHGRTGWNDGSKWQSRTLRAGPPQEVKLHYAGPLRATIEVTGPFADDPLGARYRTFITAWAGQGRVWVKHKLVNSNPEQYTAIPVARSAIELELAGAARNVLLGAAEPVAAESGNAWLHQGLFLHHTYQDIPGAAKAGSGSKVLWTGDGPADRPAGWIAAVGGPNVFVLDRLFSTNPARRLAIEGGRLVLEGVAERFQGPKDRKFRQDRRIGEPWQSEAFWLYDCTHHSSEYLLGFSAPDGAAQLGALAEAARNRLRALAPPEHYAACDVLGVGRFGTLADERAAYDKWGWTFTPKQLPDDAEPHPQAFVAWEDNHYESEADSVEGLLLMYLRTGQRGFFDQAEAWARYHANLEVWRTDGWQWKDGAIWFPQGGPQGNRPVRKPWNFEWGPNWGDRKQSPDCVDLWRAAQAKSCYCHYYGSGLADYFCLTGDPDALQAALDNLEPKDDEFRRARELKPGETGISSIRGFGRGFEVVMRTLMADPQNESLRDLARFCARVLWESPTLDERGFHPSKVGGGYGGMDPKHLSPPVKQWMDEHGTRYTVEEGSVAMLSRGDRTWPVKCFGGTWQHYYVHNGADLYARYFDDEDMRDFTIAFAQMSARYMLSPKCHQTWYYTQFDVPDLGMVFDPWAFEHTDTRDGEGCVHSGYYTRFYPDCCAKGYSLTGEGHLLERGREFWYYGSKRTYRSKGLAGGPNEVYQFAGHRPPKDDSVLETARLFYEAAHPRDDAEPPAAVKDLAVKPLGDGKAEVTFTAPADAGGGQVARYQVKAATLPIAPYEEWEYARDFGKKRNWWRAVNLTGEPKPGQPGAKERFVVSGVPAGETLHFAVRSFDDSDNRSAMSNVAVMK